MKDVTIYIPSAGRADTQHSYRRIPKAWRKNVVIVVPRGEGDAYREHIKVAEVAECPMKGIGKTRQWIIDNNESKYIMMIDDDLYFYTRIEPRGVALRTCEFVDVDRMLKYLVNCMSKQGWVHGGVAKRTEISFFHCDHREVARINNFHFMQGRKVASLKKYGVRFDLLPLMEDFHFTLSLFERGIPNILVIDYVWNQPGSHSQGGCSTYRTMELQAKASRMLHKLHPDTVQVVEKQIVGKDNWEEMKVRVDVVVQWKKAYSGKDREYWNEERASVRQYDPAKANGRLPRARVVSREK